MDSLRRRVLARDAKNNSPRQIEVTARPTETHRICIDCRRVFDPFHHYNEWFRRQMELPEAERTPYKPKSPCRDCGGRLIEVTW